MTAGGRRKRQEENEITCRGGEVMEREGVEEGKRRADGNRSYSERRMRDMLVPEGWEEK